MKKCVKTLDDELKISPLQYTIVSGEQADTATLFSRPQAHYTRDLLEAIPLPDPDQIWT